MMVMVVAMSACTSLSMLMMMLMIVVMMMFLLMTTFTFMIVVVIPVMMMVMVVIMMVVMVMLFLLSLYLVVVTVDLLNPIGRGGHRVKIEQMSVDYPVNIHISIITLYDFSLRLDGTYYGAYAGELLGLHLRCLVEQDYVAELYLLYDQVLDILLIKILFLQGFAATELILESQSIHYGHYTVELGSTEHCGLCPELRYGAYGLGYRGRFAYATRFDYYIVETAHCHDLLDLLYQIHLERTAYTAVRQCHQAVVLAVHNTSALDKTRVDIHFTYVIDDHGKLYATFIG